MNFTQQSRLSLKNLTSIFLIMVLFILIFYQKESNKELPKPTEIIYKKNKNKIFKKNRSEWMENMHRAAPETDWKSINETIRKNKITSKNQLKVREIVNSKQRLNMNRSLPIGEWEERGSNNQAGRIRTSEFDFNNEEIYCASSGGNIWRGNIDGTNWVSLNDYFQIKGIILLKRFNLLDNQRMVMVNDKNFFWTDNDGYIINEAIGLESVQSWGWIFRARLSNDNSNVIYLGVVEWDYNAWTYLPSIYMSNDSGENFTKVIELTEANGFTVGSSHFDIWLSDNGQENLYVLNDGKLYYLENENLNFITEIETTDSGNNILIGGTDQNGMDYLHCRIGNQLFTSLDSGFNWNQKGEFPSGTFTINSFECHPNNPNKIVIGGVDGYSTSNGGEDWQLINNWWEYYSDPEEKLHADLPDFSYFINPESGEEFQLICTDGGIYISYDNFETVQNLSMNGLGVSQYYSTYTSRFNPNHIYAGSQDQGFQIHLSDGSNYEGILDFEQIISGDYGHIVSGDSGVSIWTDYPGFVMYYNDIVNSTNMVSWDFQGSGYLWLPPLMIDPYENNTVYIGGGGINSQNHMVRVHYGLNGIQAEDMTYTFDSKISSMAFSPLTNNYWYVSTEYGKFYYSINNGEEFIETTSFTGPESHYFYGSSILPSPVDDQKIYIAGSGYSNPGVYISMDGGQTFIPFDENLPNTLIYELACLPDESIIFAATEVGPYAYSYQNGEWFDMAGDDAPDQTYWTVDYIDNIHTVRFGTYGRGIWDYTFAYNPVLTIGDINEDQSINIDDIILLVSILLSNSEISDYVMNVGNLNYDDSIDVIDILMLADILGG